MEPAESTLIHLECPECCREFDADRVQTFCQDCNSPFLARYDLQSAARRAGREQIASRQRGLWRWAELLPVRDADCRLTLGEGDTPLLPIPRLGQRLELKRLYVKDESTNPTGTFKARGLAVAVSRATELGYRKFVIPTAGNAGGALAFYAARGRAEAHVFMPKYAPLANQKEVRAAGADLRLVDGLLNDAARLAGEQARRHRWMDVSTFKEPYRVEGKKIMGLELAQVEGIFPAPEGAAALAALHHLQAQGWVKSDERIVLFNTGSGLKYI